MNHTDKLIEKPELAIDKSQIFLQFVEQYKIIDAQYKAASAAWDAIKEAMQAHDVDKITLDDGSTIALEAAPKVWSVDGKIAERFYKTVLDTTKLNAVAKAGEKLPKHVSYTQGLKFVKRLK